VLPARTRPLPAQRVEKLRGVDGEDVERFRSLSRSGPPAVGIDHRGDLLPEDERGAAKIVAGSDVSDPESSCTLSRWRLLSPTKADRELMTALKRVSALVGTEIFLIASLLNPGGVEASTVPADARAALENEERDPGANARAPRGESSGLR
jgi:hypothetical protein